VISMAPQYCLGAPNGASSQTGGYGRTGAHAIRQSQS
jgi:hypothetical protein